MEDDFEAFLKAQQTDTVTNFEERSKDQMRTKQTYEVDERLFDLKHLRDENGNGEVTIRFLPAKTPGDTDFVRRYEHSLTKEGRWYINNSRKTLGLADPVYDYNAKFFNDKTLTDEERKKLTLSRNVAYFANILVVDDPMEPDNNGKVFVIKYGNQIQNKIQEKIKPSFKSDVAFDAFNIFSGADFVIRIWTKKVGKNDMPQYDKSFFKEPSEIGGNAKKVYGKIWSQLYNIKEFIAEDKFKTYEELEKNLNYLLKGNTNKDEEETGTWNEEAPKTEKAKENKTTKAAPKPEVDDEIPFQTVESSTTDEPVFSEDDDDFFAQFGKK